jgi:hypothetical protein
MAKMSLVACAAMLTAGLAPAQSTSGDLFTSFQPQVKLDRRMEFEASVKKIAEANRKKNGNRWVAYSAMYGRDGGTYTFTSRYKTWEEVEKGSKNFETMLVEAIGATALPKFFAGLDGTLLRSTSEVRRRMPDMSVGGLGAEGMMGLASYRYLRSIRVQLKPGGTGRFIEAWKPWQAELNSIEPKQMALVSLSSTGHPTVTVTMYYKSLSDIDTADRLIQKSLMSDVYRTFQEKVADLSVSSNWEIHRLLPELSSVDDELMQADPFWKPKPMAKAAPAPKKQ